MKFRGHWVWLFLLANFSPAVHGQIDPVRRRLVQLGYNQPVEGRGPIAAYGFYYDNKPGFLSSNLTLRVAIAPIYLDSDLGFTGVLGPHTDVSFGVAGGGFADSYSEIRQGIYRRDESFIGHGGEISSSVYHRLNPAQSVPLWAVLRGSVHESFYKADSDTDLRFEIPRDRATFRVRAGLRWGGEEPSLTEPLALELSAWQETRWRTDSGPYGFGGDRITEPISHLLWGRALLKYTSLGSEQLFELSVTGGTVVNEDRFSAFRLGGLLPFASEFPLNIPGYYFQEISAKRFALLNGEYSFPFLPGKNWRMTTFAATGPVEYLDGLEQAGRWHSGVGAGLTFISPSGSWFASLIYGYGVNTQRSHGRGANQIGILFQYDFEAKRRGKFRWFIPGSDPYRSRAGERIFR
ncbi:MAG: hypothetical protein HY735_08700 [Verrucomicrobia bacterium]|nr:hypothetical protein [Verrucomicrobiota bacterium]